MPKPFDKMPTSHAEQVALLQSRGMSIQDPAAAEARLQHLNYYRLTAYWLPFEATHTPHRFRPGTTLEAVLALYELDRQLRLLLLDGLERIEVSVRSQWAYQMAHRHGAHSHLDSSLVRNQEDWKKALELLKKEVRQLRQSSEKFIEHLVSAYSEPLPAVWAVCEVMSLGLLSRIYGNLKPSSTRAAIAAPYLVDEKVLGSWIDHLRTVRNFCAHHSRVWNREFVWTPSLPRNKPPGLRSQFHANSRKIYNTLVLMLHLMDRITPGHSWRSQLRTFLLIQAPSQLQAMDFPPGWDSFPIWQ